ncbi:hypothetical protein BD324DRAFT_237623 [Kockovaella imperatae]|uniref:Uncharacterized protein n=1 Tax=Kockovaella imperatae TaxID=4999 RepID=A0A1Y1UQW3_9TREE|nr:hypothetical protein BD324DRAFT_237623 [Kockovaella imperatae]ORX39826.1 hypothetical protein BD324DRAFT_237623 [Kockovaella imperatae]
MNESSVSDQITCPARGNGQCPFQERPLILNNLYSSSSFTTARGKTTARDLNSGSSHWSYYIPQKRISRGFIECVSVLLYAIPQEVFRTLIEICVGFPWLGIFLGLTLYESAAVRMSPHLIHSTLPRLIQGTYHALMERSTFGPVLLATPFF